MCMRGEAIPFKEPTYPHMMENRAKMRVSRTHVARSDASSPPEQSSAFGLLGKRRGRGGIEQQMSDPKRRKTDVHEVDVIHRLESSSDESERMDFMTSESEDDGGYSEDNVESESGYVAGEENSDGEQFGANSNQKRTRRLQRKKTSRPPRQQAIEQNERRRL